MYDGRYGKRFMKYLISYKAWTDCGNGYYLENHSETTEDFESTCVELAVLENCHSQDKNFSYKIFELNEINSNLFTSDRKYIDFKDKLENEKLIDDLKGDIYLKKQEISNQKQIKEKYGMWEKYNDQMSVLEYDLTNLEKKLELLTKV